MNEEMFSGVPNPLVPTHLFRDIRGFVMLNVIASVAGTVYVSMSIIWPSQVATIYGSELSWQATGWLSVRHTTIL